MATATTASISRSVEKGTGPASGLSYGRGLIVPAALLTLGAAAIHFSVAPDHLQEYPLFGILFLLTGTSQAVLAVLTLLRPRPLIFEVAIAIAAGCIAVWAISRTVGLPFGPNEKDITIYGTDPLTILLQLLTSSGLAGVMTSFLELLAIVMFAALLARGPRSARRSRWWLASSVPSALVIAFLTFIGVGSGLNPLPEAISMSTASQASGIPMGQLITPPGSQPVDSFVLTAEVAHINGREAWTYDGSVPGPELRVRQGDRVHVELINRLPVSTTIHWHGYPLPNAEDGVAGVTQDAVKPGQSYAYDFIATIPGTYWYHAHQDTTPTTRTRRCTLKRHRVSACACG